MDIAKDLFYARETLATLFSVTAKLHMQGDKHTARNTCYRAKCRCKGEKTRCARAVRVDVGSLLYPNYLVVLNRRNLAERKTNLPQSIAVSFAPSRWRFGSCTRANRASVSFPNGKHINSNVKGTMNNKRAGKAQNLVCSFTLRTTPSRQSRL